VIIYHAKNFYKKNKKMTIKRLILNCITGGLLRKIAIKIKNIDAGVDHFETVNYS